MKKFALPPWRDAILYVLFIYSTLSIVPAPLRFLRMHNMLRVTLGVVYTASFIALFSKLAAEVPKQWWRFAVLAGIFLLYPVIARATSSPEEQVHFLEYGLVGVLFARALAGDRPHTWKIYLGALVIGSIVGWIDELLQGLVPNRHYDIRDIWFNVVSVTLGLTLRSLYPHKPSNH